ncbi:hypothetical protein JQ595_32545 [Bradyrhizobium japonicum]|uniref:hypothetical protein n=1 Tax=Bradyrhizobium japonicum TaxID=375 RepID=UPI001BAC3558|nr:hypothetical protein [Bradyrhizobium japonicum]MBR0733486.1 hypothetical protein [Bradyrhizobium japonicum]
MNKHLTEGLLFFDGGQDMRVVAYNISQTGAVVHSDRLGLLPIDFYITFDDFLTVARCRLAWRYRDDFGVVIERWLDLRQRIESGQAG